MSEVAERNSPGKLGNTTADGGTHGAGTRDARAVFTVVKFPNTACS